MKKKYIVSNPTIMGGTPVIKGTRIPIEAILYRLKEGNSVDEIHKMYSWIDKETIVGAIEEAIQTLVATFNGKKIFQA